MRSETSSDRHVEAIVFDLWFTLITPEDFLQPYVSTGKRLPEALRLDPEPFLDYWNDCSDRVSRTPRPIDEYVFDYMSSVKRTMTEEDRLAFDSIWEYHDMALASPREDVLEALGQLSESGIRLGLLSNAHEREIRTWSSSPLARYFDEAVFSCHLGHLKPEPKAYLAVLDRLGVPPDRAVFVGDGASQELEGARSVGFQKAVWMRGFYDAWGLGEEMTRGYMEQADAVITKIGDLP